MEVYNRFKKDLFWVMIIFFILQFAWHFLPIGRDNSDGEKRSGVSVHVDMLTGCEYLGGKNGGLTPRMDANGHHICTRQLTTKF